MKLKSSIPEFIFIFSILLSSVIADLNSDKQALLEFAANVYHSHKLNWNVSKPVCSTWVGITCNPSNTRVIDIHLPAVGLFGSIPNNTLENLSALRVLSLPSNFLHGNLPSNVLSIPSLKYVYLQNNNFSGAVPASLSFNLIVLELSFNSLSGIIPTIISNLTRLAELNIQNNSFSGAIPNLSLKRLKLLNLSYNNLNGSIPFSLQKYPHSSFLGNSLLCGEPLNHCSNISSSLSPSPSPIYLPSVSPVIMENRHNKRLLGLGSIIALATGGAAVLFLLVIMFIMCCSKRTNKRSNAMSKGKSGVSSDEKTDTKSISFGSGVQAASKNKLSFFEGCNYNFDLEDLLRASAEVLGKGTYGTTYKAVLDEETTVVVKRLKEVVLGKKEFEQHMEVVERVGKHPNVLSPKAYYYSRDEKLLVYNYMPQGSLFAHLHGSKDARRSPLDWDTRLKISVAIAKAIAHIHSEGGIKCIHGNIKSTNVLLTEEFEPYVSDVALTPLLNFPVATSVSQRATGYRAPEAIDVRKMTEKSDVYSFGVLLLEMLTGKTTIQYAGHYDDVVVDLPRWVKSVVREEWTAEVFDLELLKQQGIEEEMVQMLQIALACVAKGPESRPEMDEVAKMLEEFRQSDTKTRPSSASEVETP